MQSKQLTNSGPNQRRGGGVAAQPSSSVFALPRRCVCVCVFRFAVALFVLCGLEVLNLITTDTAPPVHYA